MKADLGRLMRQAQKMQSQMEEAQAELEQLEITGEAGGGMVRAVLSGTREVRRISIEDDSLLGDREMLEDLVGAAVNDALRKVEEASRDKMSGLAGGIGLPPGFKLPF